MTKSLNLLEVKLKIFGLPPFHMQNTRSRSVLFVEFLFVIRFSFTAFLKTLECKGITRSCLLVGVVEHGDMQKGCFQMMV